LGIVNRPVKAACLGAAFAALMIVISSRGHLDRMTFGDGVIYRYVATHLGASPAEVDPALGPRGTSLRYGRIGLPVLIWVASAGREAAMPYAQPALMMLSGAAIAAATATLFPRSGVIFSLAPFVAIGLTAAFAGGFAEAPAVALSLWGVALALQRRAALAALLFAAAMLMKESSIFALAGTMGWLAARDRRGAVLLATSLIPVGLWFGYVAARYGHIPPLDPWLRQTHSVAPPLVGIWRSLTQTGAVAATLAATHAVAAVAVVVWARRSVFRLITAFGAVLLVSTGPFVWGFIGDGIRQASFVETAIVLAVVATIAPETVSPDAVSP
jgi:hypothetical protein